MKILFLSTNDNLGGAAIVTRRLVEALRHRNVDARMLVARKSGNEEWIAQVNPAAAAIAKVAERGEIFLNNGFNLPDLWKVSTASFGAVIYGHPWVKEADIIVINWINQGLMSLADLKRLNSSGKRIIWMMHDLWCATGICHLPGDCRRFTTGCSHCPLLHSMKGNNDLSHRIWKKKLRLMEGNNVKLVAMSRWQREIALESPLIGSRSIEVLPHAFPVEEYSTTPNFESLPDPIRGIIGSRKIIVMGAARLDDPVKDLPMAIESLNTFKDQHPGLAGQCEAVFFGNIRNPDAFNNLRMPWHHAGTLGGNTLQQLYAASSVVLSTSKFETMGATLMEGMAAGAIPVTFGNGGQTDIVTDGENGYVADYGSPVSVARCLAKALADPAPFSRQAQHLSVADRFSADAIAGRFLKLVNQHGFHGFA